MDPKTLELLSRQIQVGDVLELTLIEDEEGEGFLSQMIEIPIACKHVTENYVSLHFYPHKFMLDIEPEDDGTSFLPVVINCLEITDANQGVLDIDVEDESSYQNVKWKKIAIKS